jgi:hypothetical protein
MGRQLPCEQMWDLLSVYADGECTSEERIVVEQHLSVCAACRAHLALLRQMASVLIETEDVVPPPDLREAILAATVYRPSWFQRLRKALPAWVPSTPIRAMVAVAVAAMIGGVLFLSHPPHPTVVASAPEVTLFTPTPPVSKVTIRGEAVGKRIRPTSSNKQRVATHTTFPSVQARIASAIAQQPVHARPGLYGIHGGRTISQPTARLVRITPNMGPPVLDPPADAPDKSKASTRDISPIIPPRIAETRNNSSGEPIDSLAESRLPAPEGSRVMIANAGPAISAGAVASLADLRRALRQRNESSPVASVSLPFEGEKLVTVDVFRTRF